MTDIDTLSDAEIEQAIAEVETPLTVSLLLSSNEKVRLARLCNDAACSEAEYIVDLIREQLGKKVGAPCIKNASAFSGVKITAPTGSVSRS
jgi:hypothetical protein